MKDTIRKIIKEANSSRFAGYYNGPLTMGEKDWDKSSLGSFTKKVSNFFNAELQYDSYDGSLDSHKKDSKKLETKSKRISKYNKKHPQANDEDGGIINQTPGKGKKIVPIKEWVELDSIDLNEDLAVWFGKKKKPKGSKQPKGPWVNICRKVDGKHPPCGRSDTSKGAYPKCRAAGVAGKMSDSEKRSACQQKRNAEKKDTQTGKGQKPVMTSYKKKKTNEDMKRIVRLTENELIRLIKTVIKEQIDLKILEPGNDMNPVLDGKGNQLTSDSSSISWSDLTKKENNKGGIELTCYKIDLDNPSNPEVSKSGPYPWDKVVYNKESRPIKLELYPNKTSDAVWGGPEMTIGFEEIKSPALQRYTDKKYIIVTYNSPGVTGKQYCSVTKRDELWDDNLFNLGNNSNLIETNPRF
jgi:hypothetical protein